MINYRYPLLPRLLVEARAYALESFEHTTDYDGWDKSKREQKMARITRGTFAQLWAAEFCRINNIEHHSDRSSPYVPDKSDMTIRGQSVDCKESVIEQMWPQVSVNSDKNPVDVYLFFTMPETLDFIRPVGGISYQKYMKNRFHIPLGMDVPGTNRKQIFNKGSYFINPEFLTPFYQVLQLIGKKKETEIPLPLQSHEMWRAQFAGEEGES